MIRSPDSRKSHRSRGYRSRGHVRFKALKGQLDGKSDGKSWAHGSGKNRRSNTGTIASSSLLTLQNCTEWWIGRRRVDLKFNLAAIPQFQWKIRFNGVPCGIIILSGRHESTPKAEASAQCLRSRGLWAWYPILCRKNHKEALILAIKLKLHCNLIAESHDFWNWEMHKKSFPTELSPQSPFGSSQCFFGFLFTLNLPLYLRAVRC